jgi:cysteine desulfurase
MCLVRFFLKLLLFENKGAAFKTLRTEIMQFLLKKRRAVYFDHNATTTVATRIRRTMNRVLKYHYGNPSSLYSQGLKATGIIDKARCQLATAILADPSEIYFTSSATEANNAVLKSLGASFFPTKTKIISTPIEHSSVINTLEYLKTQGITVDYCKVDNKGRVILSSLEKLIDNNTFLICCMLANNETGVIQDIVSINQIAKKHKVLLLSDCVQALGKIDLNVHRLGVDYATFSAHKLHGPKGIGALYIKKGSPFTPFIHGGHQESGMRSGTESVHNIAGFGAACEFIDRKITSNQNHIRLKQSFVNKLQKIKPDCIINSPENFCLPQTINIRFTSINNSEMMAMLNYHGVAVSGGSACNTNEEKPSHVLTAIGLSNQEAKESIRFSFGECNTIKDIDYTIGILKDFITGKILFVNSIHPVLLDEFSQKNKSLYIIDVRPKFMLKSTPGIPGSHEIAYSEIDDHVNQIPRDREVLVVCQNGPLAQMAAYYLKTKGINQISTLQGGIIAWCKTKSL